MDESRPPDSAHAADKIATAYAFVAVGLSGLVMLVNSIRCWVFTDAGEEDLANMADNLSAKYYGAVISARGNAAQLIDDDVRRAMLLSYAKRGSIPAETVNGRLVSLPIEADLESLDWAVRIPSKLLLGTPTHAGWPACLQQLLSKKEPQLQVGFWLHVADATTLILNDRFDLQMPSDPQPAETIRDWLLSTIAKTRRGAENRFRRSEIEEAYLRADLPPAGTAIPPGNLSKPITKSVAATLHAERKVENPSDYIKRKVEAGVLTDPVGSGKNWQFDCRQFPESAQSKLR